MYRIDGLENEALKAHLASLPPDEKEVIESCVQDLVDLKIDGIGKMTALHIMFKIFRLLRRNDQR